MVLHATAPAEALLFMAGCQMFTVELGDNNDGHLYAIMTLMSLWRMLLILSFKVPISTQITYVSVMKSSCSDYLHVFSFPVTCYTFSVYVTSEESCRLKIVVPTLQGSFGVSKEANGVWPNFWEAMLPHTSDASHSVQKRPWTLDLDL